MKTAKKIKQSVCLVLSVLFLLSTFAVLPISAATVSTNGVAYSLGDATVTVDGEIEDIWKNAPSYDLSVREKDSKSQVNIKYLWDEKFLYILADIKDDTPHTSNEKWWNRDTMEIVLCINSGGTQTRRMMVDRDGNIHSGSISYFGGTTADGGYFWGTEWKRPAHKENLDNSGWVVEYAIPITNSEGVGTNDEGKNNVSKKDQRYVTIDCVYYSADSSSTNRIGLLGWSSSGVIDSGQATAGNLGRVTLSDEKIAVATFSGASVTLGSDLTMNYYVDVLDPSISVDDLSVRFTMNERVETVSEYAKSFSGEYIFAFSNITPQQMCDNIKAELLLGTNIIDTKESYSVKQNAQALLTEYKGSTSDRGKAIVRLATDMLYYGDAAQKYTDYNTNTLATSGVTDIAEASTLLPSENDKRVLAGNTYTKIKIFEANVFFDSVNKLSFDLYIDENKKEGCIIKLDGESIALSTLESVGEGYYRLVTGSISAINFDKQFILTLLNGTNTVSELKYSVNSYSYSMMTNTDDENMKQLALALYRYGVSAKAYSELKVVTYADFGAKGDGRTNDIEAIIAAHEYANEHDLPVEAGAGKTFYIGECSKGAVIQTSTDFTGASFVIDDRIVPQNQRGVPIFTVYPDKAPYKLSTLKQLSIGQTNIGATLPEDSFIMITEAGTKRYIRKGYNSDNDGVDQNEVIVVDKNGNISADSPVIWDYTNITSAVVTPIDKETLTIKGGTFTTIVNSYVETYVCYKRGFHIKRSNVTVEGMKHYLKNEGADGAPYDGFMVLNECYNVTLKDCIFTPHRTFWRTVNGNRQSAGTYDILPTRVIKHNMINCKQEVDILDQSYWGIIGTNFCKNITMNGCELSRIDAHQGVHDVTIIDSKLGWLGIDITGSGELYVEGSSLYGTSLIKLRDDYGSTWHGNVTVKDCTWTPNRGKSLTDSYYYIIGGTNLQQHYYGYDCYLPTNIMIQGLRIDDSKATTSYKGIMLFADLNPNRTSESAENALPYKYYVTETATISGLTFEKGKWCGISTNEFMFRNVDLNVSQ